MLSAWRPWIAAAPRAAPAIIDNATVYQVFMISPPDGSSNTSVRGARLRSCFAPREKSNSVFYQPLTPPTGLGLLTSAPRRRISVGQRAARSLPERWPAVLPRGDVSFAVQGHRRALEGQPSRCPFLIGERKWMPRHSTLRCSPLWRCSAQARARMLKHIRLLARERDQVFDVIDSAARKQSASMRKS